MPIKINFDSSRIPEAPTIILADRNGEKLGMLPARDIIVKDSLNNAAELSFCVYKFENEVKNDVWDKIVNYRLAWCKEWDTWFEITVDTSESDKTVKNVSCIQLAQAELSQTNLYNIEINTENDIARDDYAATVLFSPDNPNGSLLHRIMEKAPHYSVSHVDSTITNIQRTFSFDDLSVYDAFQQISEEIGCLFRFHSGTNPDGSIQRTISVHDLQSNCLNPNCSHRGEFTGKCPKCGSVNVLEGFGRDTTIFVTPDELADEIQLTTDNDSVKNCFKLEAGDELMTATVRNCNPNGSDYIWHISGDLRKIMSGGLVERLDSYDKKYRYYQTDYVVDLNQEFSVKSSELANMPYEASKPTNKAEARILYGPIIIERPAYEWIYKKKYNPIAEKYGMETLPGYAKGYPALMTAYYNAVDLEYYLLSSMMPEAEIKETCAEKELDALMDYFKEGGPVAVSDISIISPETAKSAIITMARTVVDSRYKIEANEGYELISGQIWQGGFTITRYSDETDSASTQNNITIPLTDSKSDYIKQSIQKMLRKNHKDDMGISGLFQLDNDAFKTELEKYCLNRLTSFHDACESCINILIEEGTADKETWSDSEGDDNLYEALYLPYKEKLSLIKSEIQRRRLDIAIVKKMQEYISSKTKEIHSVLNFEEYLKENGEALWIEFCSYRREDKYSNSNYISDGLNNAEIFKKAMEFLEAANNELYKSAELQHSITASLKNLLAMEKFAPLVEYFQAGNWVRVQVDDTIYKLRLTDYEINYGELDKISVSFSDVMYAPNGVNMMENIIRRSEVMSKSYYSIQRQASQGSKGSSILQNWVDEGLHASNVKIMNDANNKTQTWDEHGMSFRQYDYADDTYRPTQMKITDSSILFTDDNWKSVKTAIGNIYYTDPASKKLVRSYGINGETIVGKLLLGEQLGINNKDGSLTFDNNGLVVKNNNNAFHVTPNDNILISLTTKKNGTEERIFYVNSNGDLFIKGNGKDLDISENKTISDKIGKGDILDAWNGITSQIQLETNGECDELCFYTQENPENNEPKEQRLSCKISNNGLFVYNEGNLIGRLGISESEQAPSKKRITFELMDDGDCFSFIQKDKQNNVLKELFRISGNGEIHLGCNMQGNGYTMDDINLTNVSFNGATGITKKIFVITDITQTSDNKITPTFAEITVKDGIITDISQVITSTY